MRRTNGRRAFTMIELLFVIVILGIVGGLALEAVRQYYDGIYRTQEYAKRAAQADHILEQISRYFENGMAGSMALFDTNAAPAGACAGAPGNDLGDENTVAFVSIDAEGLRGHWNGRWLPNWSPEGSISGNVLTVPEAKYDAAGALTDATVYDDEGANAGVCSDFWNGAANSKYNNITASTATTLTLTSTPQNGEDKYILKTGYAFRAYNGDFRMYSGFQPWQGENYTNGTGTLLAEKVAHFAIISDNTGTTINSPKGNVYALKICMFGLRDDLADADEATADDVQRQICRTRMVHVRY